MTAKIEIYNDNGELVSKCEVPPYTKLIDYEADHEIHKYNFVASYAEYIPKLQREVIHNGLF